MGLFSSSKPKKVYPSAGEIALAKIGQEQVAAAKQFNPALNKVAEIAARDETPLLRARQAADNAQQAAGANEVAALQMAASGAAGGTAAANRALADEATAGLTAAANEAAKVSADRISRGAGAALARGAASADILGSVSAKQQAVAQNKSENRQRVREAKQAAIMATVQGGVSGVMKGSQLQAMGDLNKANNAYSSALATGDKGQIAAAKAKVDGLSQGLVDHGWAMTNPFTGARNRAAAADGRFDKVGWAQRIGVPWSGGR